MHYWNKLKLHNWLSVWLIVSLLKLSKLFWDIVNHDRQRGHNPHQKWSQQPLTPPPPHPRVVWWGVCMLFKFLIDWETINETNHFQSVKLYILSAIFFLKHTYTTARNTIVIDVIRVGIRTISNRLLPFVGSKIKIHVTKISITWFKYPNRQ